MSKLTDSVSHVCTRITQDEYREDCTLQTTYGICRTGMKDRIRLFGDNDKYAPEWSKNCATIVIQSEVYGPDGKRICQKSPEYQFTSGLDVAVLWIATNADGMLFMH